MNATNYWPFVRENFIWNAAVATLQFWTADLELHVLNSAIEQVYNAFIYTISTHLLCQQSEDVLFGHFVTMLNAAFESKLALEDKGYKSGSENFKIPTPLRRTPRIQHVSSDGNFSFDHSTPCTTATSHSHHKPVCCQLSFSSSDDKESSAVDIPSPYSMSPPQNPMYFAQQPLFMSIYTICDDLEEDDDDFHTVDLNDEHWITDPVPDRPLCIMNICNHILCILILFHATQILLQYYTRIC